MSIIEIRRDRNSAAAAPFQHQRHLESLPASGPHARGAVSEYARALSEARIASFKVVALRSGAPAPRSLPDQTASCRSFALFRRIIARWTARRQHERRRRELESILRSLDAHTLADLGFEMKPCPASHWHAQVRCTPPTRGCLPF
jgi:hypothetical protein